MNTDIFKPGSTNVVLGHPFSGALYAYFDQELTDGSHAAATKWHSYYKTLYGRHFKENMDVAIALSLIYDNVILIAADNALPDHGKNLNNDYYYNPEFGLYTSWNSIEKADRLPSELIQQALEDKELQRIFNDIPKHAWDQILTDVQGELLLSSKFNASLYTSGRRQAIAQRLLILAGRARVDFVPTEKIKLVSNYLDITGLLFQPLNIDAFYYLKSEKELKIYSQSFLHLVEGFSPENSHDIKRQLLLLIKEAIAKDKLNSKISGMFKGTSTAMSFASMIPVAGIVAGIAGIGADLTARTLDKVDHRYKWYELAGQIERVKSLEKIHASLESIK